MQLLKKLWQEESGFVVSIELILISSVAVIGLIVGLATARNAVVSEISDVAGAIQDLNQGYLYSGVTGQNAFSRGSSYDDNSDAFVDRPEDRTNDADNCVEFDQTPQNE